MSFGFRVEDWETLSEALVGHAQRTGWLTRRRPSSAYNTPWKVL